MSGHSERSEESWLTCHAHQILRCAQNDEVRAQNDGLNENTLVVDYAFPNSSFIPRPFPADPS